MPTIFKMNKETNNLPVLPRLFEKVILNKFEEERKLRVLKWAQIFLNRTNELHAHSFHPMELNAMKI